MKNRSIKIVRQSRKPKEENTTMGMGRGWQREYEEHLLENIVMDDPS